VHPTRSLVVGAVLAPLVLLGALGPATWASAEPGSERAAPSVRSVARPVAPSTASPEPEPQPQPDPAGVPLWQQVAGLATPASYAVPVPTDVRYGVVSSRRVSFGVDVVEVRRSSPRLVAHVARVSPGAAARMRSVAATDRVAGVRERTTSICARTACAVAVNGDYWDAQGRPVGLLVADGELYQSPPLLHAQALLGADGAPFLGPLPWSAALSFPSDTVALDAVNRAIGDGQIVLYTPRRGATTGTPAGTRELILSVVDTDPSGVTTVRIVDQRTTGNVSIEPGRMVLAGRGPIPDARLAALGTSAAQGNGTGTLRIDTAGAAQGVGGSPTLVRGGLYDFPYSDPGSATQSRQPRTLLGWTAAGEILLVAADGRRPGYSDGLSYPEAAQLLVTLGAIEGIALDGGGSTTLSVEGRVWNRPSDRAGERPVASALVVGPAPITSERLAGSDRYATAVAASQRAFPQGAAAVTLVSGESFPDALAGGPATQRGGAPMLLTARDRLPAVVEAELLRLRPGFVSIIGGPAAVAPAVEARLRALGFATLRTQGVDRYDTSARVSAAAFPTGARVAYVATGTAFPDALAAGSGAAVEGGPVLLTRPGALPATVAAELRRLAPAEIVVVGGTTAVSAAVAAQLRALGPVVRIAGADRFATAAAVARRVGIPGSGAVVATGLAFPDALSGAWYAARAGRPLLLVQRTCAPEPALRAADDLGARELTVLGGLSAVGAPVERMAVCVNR